MEQPPEDPTQRPARHGDERDDATRAGDLARLAAAAEDATFGETGDGKVAMPGVLSGDVGPKGKVAAGHRSLSRRQRGTYGDVPRGASSPGSVGYLLLPMVLGALALVGVAVLIGWLVS